VLQETRTAGPRCVPRPGPVRPARRWGRDIPAGSQYLCPPVESGGCKEGPGRDAYWRKRAAPCQTTLASPSKVEPCWPTVASAANQSSYVGKGVPARDAKSELVGALRRGARCNTNVYSPECQAGQLLLGSWWASCANEGTTHGNEKRIDTETAPYPLHSPRSDT
jgi:hypothetical protein